MSWKKRGPFAAIVVAGLVLVLAVSVLALGDGAFAAGPHRPPKPGPGRVVNRAPRPTPAPRLGPAGIEVSFRLDPWLLSGFYGSGFWVSPAVFGPFVQNDKTFTVDARASGHAAGGAKVTDPQWSSADPSMARATPAHGSEVKLTVARAGQTTLRVSSAGLTKELAVNAEAKGDGLQVQITQH
jgi:hypothetical protein